jgi:hypothetical protein
MIMHKSNEIESSIGDTFHDGNFINIANPLNSVYVFVYMTLIVLCTFLHCFNLSRFPYLTDCVNETIKET